MTMKIALVILIIGLGVAIATELLLRWVWGFGNPLLYVADERIGYLLAPNQAVRRSGNRIEINQFSMRSPQISPTRPPQTLRMLLLGDSIANGGWWTDQPNILSQLLQTQLLQNQFLADAGIAQVEVLNASANSWGPRNELAYLKRFGLFESQALILLINTDDLFATAPTSIQVGRDRNYPSRKPPLAIAEVLSRYLFKAPPIPEMQAVLAEGGDRVGFNLEAIGQIQAIAQQHDAQFVLAMTPLLRELGSPGSRDYELKARQRLLEFTTEHQIPYIDFLPVFSQQPDFKALYQDHIHLSATGNQIVRDALIDTLRSHLSHD